MACIRTKGHPEVPQDRHLRAPMLEFDTTRDLKGISLEGRSVLKFLKVLYAHAHFSRRQHQIGREAECVDLVMRGCLSWGNAGSGLVRGLSLLVADQPDLQI